jgi:hypothetical protein
MNKEHGIIYRSPNPEPERIKTDEEKLRELRKEIQIMSINRQKNGDDLHPQ